jgi:UDP-N-acetyl-D-mannosaminuronate dehydrogenase
VGIEHHSSIKVVKELQKIIQNTQRHLNIELNELYVFDKMNINTFEVLEAAKLNGILYVFQPPCRRTLFGVDPKLFNLQIKRTWLR